MAAKPSIKITLLESSVFSISDYRVLADPRSFATTNGMIHDSLPARRISGSIKNRVCVFFFSSGY